MKLPLAISAVLIFAILTTLLMAERSEMTASIAVPTELGGKRAVLVELFTSEGCSSCPPADRLLTEISKQKSDDTDTITLAYHVDYWDRLGWKDRFSSVEYSQRQEAYASKFGLSSIYTPQMVVNGTAEFVGSDRSKATKIIANAAPEPTGILELSRNGGKLTADIHGLPSHTGTTVYLAVAESGLITKVGSGENAGSVLEHTSVVRQLTSAGEVNESENKGRFEIELPRNAEWKDQNLKYVVFAQENSSLRVLATAAVK